MSKNKIYHLASCSTCKKILSTLQTSKCILQDIKNEPIQAKELDRLAELAGSYEILFSRRAIKYKTLKLKEVALTEKDFKKWILKDYTFLKRPVIVVGKKIFVGNANKEVNAARESLND